jgi:hypothetical protein
LLVIEAIPLHCYTCGGNVDNLANPKRFIKSLFSIKINSNHFINPKSFRKRDFHSKNRKINFIMSNQEQGISFSVLTLGKAYIQLNILCS